MADERYVKFTLHAETMLKERSIRREWAEAALAAPDWTEPDSKPDRVRVFKAIIEAGDKILRVVYCDEGDERRIVTLFFDRNARWPGGI